MPLVLAWMLLGNFGDFYLGEALLYFKGALLRLLKSEICFSYPSLGWFFGFVFFFLFWQEILASSLARAVVAARLPDTWKSWTQGLFPFMINTALQTRTTPSPSSPSPQPQLHPELLSMQCSAPPGQILSVFRHGRSKAVPEIFLQPFPNRISQTNKREFLCANSASCR